jgi:hypothetical protein
MTLVARQGVTRMGPRPLLIAGSAIAAGGMLWLSRINEHSTFVNGMLGPEMILGIGLGILLVPINLVGLSKVANNDTGVASSLVSVGQQVGGSIGLAVAGTVAWSAVASSLRSHVAATAQRAGVHLAVSRSAALQTEVYHQALANGFSRGFLVSAAVLALALVIALVVIHVRRADLSGASPTSQPGPGELPADTRDNGKADAWAS